MPFLKQQIEIVNDLLRALPLADKRFAAGKFETIAVDVARQEGENVFRYFPAVMSENYEAQEVVVNDIYPILIYHKILNKGYKVNIPASVGDRFNGVQETVNIKMVVFAKWSEVKMRAEQLEALITANFPDQISESLVRPLRLDDLNVTLQSSNLNSAEVWAQEYRGTPLRLAPEDIYFSINYSLKSDYRKGCFKICDCEV